MGRPLVSIITPAYNQARFIEETLRSVEAQEYPHIEHVVLDDASTDETVEILKRYEGRYNLRWSTEPHEGQAAQIRRGFARAEGDILAWLNSDDVYLPGAISAAVEAFERNRDAQLIYGDVFVIDAESRTYAERRLCALDWYDFLGQGNCLAQPASFWTRRIYDRVGGIDPNLYFQMDLDFYIRVARAGRMRHLRRYLAKIRMHPEGKMVKAEQVRRTELALLQERYLPPGALRHLAYGRPWLLTRQFVRYALQGDLGYASRKVWNRLRRTGSG